jgi:hypothetical protein
MASARTDILFPVGRLVGGNLYQGKNTNSKGEPLVYKTGPDVGKPRSEWYFAVAVPKTPGQHWAQSEWGQKMYAAGAAAFPTVHQSRDFSWKIDDGDSNEPSLKGNVPSQREGWPGHWIIHFSNGKAPKVYQQPTPGAYVEMTEQGAVKPGYHIQVFGDCMGNGSAQTPGIYVNHNMVLFIKPDAEISFGPDAAAVFGGSPVTQALPGAASFPFQPPPVAAAAAPPVVPNPAFLAVPPAPVPVAPPAPVRKLTAKAGGATYEQLIAAGWTDPVLIANGLMEA